MSDSTITILVAVLGIGFVAWLLVRQQQESATHLAPPPGTSLSGIAGPGDSYSKAFNLLATAITNPNEIQHALGLPGSDGWGEGAFGTDYEDLPLDLKIYTIMSKRAHQAQRVGDVSESIRRQCYAAAIYLMPALRQGTCCDFDPHVPLGKGGGHMEYLGNYKVSFNQNGRQRVGDLRKLTAAEIDAIYNGATPYPPFYGTIPYNT